LLSSVVHWLLAAIVWLVQVILDVVFNHTAEGNEKGPTLSFRGLDNRVYYMLAPLGEYYNYRYRNALLQHLLVLLVSSRHSLQMPCHCKYWI
jgi:hypothetical protein